jgi:hypothetical protein
MCLAPNDAKRIYEEWKTNLSKTVDRIEDLEARSDIMANDPRLLTLRRQREVQELEVEGWGIAVAQQDSDETKSYKRRLREIADKITATASDTSGSEQDKSTTVSSH